MPTRRQFLHLSAAMSAAALVSKWSLEPRPALAYYQSGGLKKFAQPLRGIGPSGIPVAVPDLRPAPVTGGTHYTIDTVQFTDTLHPNLGPTTLWGYNPTRALGVTGKVTPRHLGGIIVAQKGKPIQITFRNNLPSKHPLPVDTTIMGAEDAPNRTSVHLHGGLVPWVSDGGPFAWWDPQGHRGISFRNNQVLNPNAAANEAEYYYPNNQSARMLWYHDHAMGITRLNAYAGIASAYIIRDSFESNLRNLGLPDFIENGGREIPIVIQDKIFVGANIEKADPTWTGVKSPGSLWYPHEYEIDRWELEPPANPPAISCVPEMFGDTMLANGVVYPEVSVEPRLYRLRVLNACSARFLNLQLYVDDGSPDGITLNAKKNPRNDRGPDFLVIGTEGGFLPFPVNVDSNRPFNADKLSGSLVTGPAERWDLLVDFRAFAGKKIILYNDAPAPFPMGDPSNDFFPGAPDNPTQPVPGYGPNTRQILRFVVVAGTRKADPPLNIHPHSNFKPGIPDALVPILPGVALPPPPGIPIRHLTLNETFDEFGRLIQMLGTNIPLASGEFGRAYVDPTTESPRAGSTEVWQIANLTGDTHPMHFHLVNVHVLSRRPFDAAQYNGTPAYTGPARGPDATELGWKETVKMHPGEVTTVIMKFDLASVPFSVPASPRTGGHEFVWHCHILDHEEHDMMRPLIVS